MRISALVRIVMFGALPFLLGGLAACRNEFEWCKETRKCGSKTLSACVTYYGCRFKTDDGHSWSCPVTETAHGIEDGDSCENDSCRVAAQEASDWCFMQKTIPTPMVERQVIITEVMHNPEVVDDEVGEWFEIHNPRGETVDLFGCEIRDRSSFHTIAAHFFVPTGAFRTAAIFKTGGGFTPDYTYSGITFDNDEADEVSIWCGSKLIDRFEYWSSQAAISGRALSWAPSGYQSSVARKTVPDYVCLAKSVYNTSGIGTATLRDYGTPGALNPSCP